MAEIRYVKTKIWRDSWFSQLSVKAQNLFFFIITNDATRLSGYYEMPIRQMAAQTKLTEKEVTSAMDELKEKIVYFNGWVCIKNYAEHQNAANSPKVQALIEREMKKVPQAVVEYSNSNSNSVPIDRVSIGYQDMAQNIKGVDKAGDNTEDNVKKKYGEFKNVLLTDAEKEKLKVRYGKNEALKLVEELSIYIQSKGVKYKDHYATIQGWARKKGLQVQSDGKPPKMIPEVQPDKSVRLIPNPDYHE